VTDKEVLINRGKLSGMTAGSELVVVRVVDTGIKDPDTGKSITRLIGSRYGPIEIPALRRRSEQRFVHRRGNAEVKVDSPATKLQLQQFLGFVVANRRKGG
jgi:hypothetical protein